MILDLCRRCRATVESVVHSLNHDRSSIGQPLLVNQHRHRSIGTTTPATTPPRRDDGNETVVEVLPVASGPARDRSARGLVWSRLSLTVPTRQGRKTILTDCSGSCLPGQVSLLDPPPHPLAPSASIGSRVKLAWSGGSCTLGGVHHWSIRCWENVALQRPVWDRHKGDLARRFHHT